MKRLFTGKSVWVNWDCSLWVWDTIFCSLFSPYCSPVFCASYSLMLFPSDSENREILSSDSSHSFGGDFFNKFPREGFAIYVTWSHREWEWKRDAFPCIFLSGHCALRSARWMTHSGPLGFDFRKCSDWKHCRRRRRGSLKSEMFSQQ